MVAWITGGEQESLHVSLDRHRDEVLWKLEGLDDEQLRRPMTPSGTNLLGLVKHLAAGEYAWFCLTFGRASEPLPSDENDENADLRVTPEETTADIVAFYGRARAAADRAIDELDLDDVGPSWFGDTVSMRWVLTHPHDRGDRPARRPHGHRARTHRKGDRRSSAGLIYALAELTSATPTVSLAPLTLRGCR